MSVMEADLIPVFIRTAGLDVKVVNDRYADLTHIEGSLSRAGEHQVVSLPWRSHARKPV